MRYAVPAAFAALAVLAVACGDDDNGSTQTPIGTHTSSASATATHTPVAIASSTATSAPMPPSTPANVCQTNPDPATPALVVVNQPAPNAQVTSPVTVSGSINAFEATFEIAIKDASGSDIATKTGHSQMGQTLSPFSESVPFSVSAQTPACLWVFQFSAQDGSPSKVEQVPIILLP